MRSDLIRAQNNKVYPNLSPKENQAFDELKHLQDSGEIVIQPADKNAGVCVMNCDDYIKEAERQLKDTYVDADGNTKNYYKKVDPKEVDRQFTEVKSFLNEGFNLDTFLNENMILFFPPNLKLPKIHKH